jgi:hypothetical protein
MSRSQSSSYSKQEKEKAEKRIEEIYSTFTISSEVNEGNLIKNK